MTRPHVFEPSYQEIDRPTCPQCGTLTWLARIAPDKPHYDRRTFECPVCGYSQDVIVKYEKR